MVRQRQIQARRARGGSTLAVLRLASYRRLWLGQLVSQLGDAFTEVALVYFVATRAGSPLYIGLAIAAMLLPVAVVGPFAGVFADRHPQRRIMVLADLWRLAVVAAMLPVARSGEVPLLLALVVAEGIGTAFFTPARAAILPRLVGTEQVPQAVSLSQATTAAVAVAGPGLGGLLIAATTPIHAFAVDAFTFLVSAILLLSLEVAPARAASAAGSQPGYVADLRTGFTALARSPHLLFLVSLLVDLSLVFGSVSTSMSGLLVQEFRLPPQGFGATQAAQGAGAVAGSLVAPLGIAVVGGTVVLVVGAGLLGAVMAGVIWVATLVASGGAWTVYPWVFLLGMMTASLNVTAQALLMALTPVALLGRVASVMQAAANAANMLGIVAGGWLASHFGSLTVTAGAGAVTASVAAASLAVPAFRTLRRHERALHAASPASAAPDNAVPAEAARAAVAAGLRSVPMRESLLLRESAQWRRLSDQLAFSIMALLERGERSVDQISQAVSAEPEAIATRIRRLEQAGLVREGETPDTYRLVARDVRLTPEALGGVAGVERMIAWLVEPGLEQLRRMAGDVPPDLPPQALGEWLRQAGYEVQLSSQVLRLRPQEWAELARTLEGALHQIAEPRPRGPGSDHGSEQTCVFTVLSLRLPDAIPQAEADQED